MAERVGFEPTVGVNPLRFSSPLHNLRLTRTKQELLRFQTIGSRQSTTHPSNSWQVITPSLRQVCGVKAVKTKSGLRLGQKGQARADLNRRPCAGTQDDSRLGCYFCLVLFLTSFFCFASIASNASDKYGGIDLSPRSHRETVIILTPSAFASCA